ncbi:MAG TPA: ATP-dependent DNA ligase [Longimicrobiales bacterium]
MNLPLKPPLLPMEAHQVDELPVGAEWQYEPKWDGFRCIVFRDGDDIQLQSKSAKPLARYFPDVVESIRQIGAKRFVLDGEIVIPAGDVLSFDDLLQRIHPAASRVRKLAAERPALFVGFDLLLTERGKVLTGHRLVERRERLESFAARFFEENSGVRLSPRTSDIDLARKWLTSVKGGLDGVIAKNTELPYASGERTGMVKIKALRTADCVVGGFRYASKGKTVGSLLLGLYDADGLLHHVGFTSSFSHDQKQALTDMIEALGRGSGFSGRAPGGPSRWSTERSSQWEPLPPRLVVEVQYDHFSEGRFRHGTRFLRWRPDKEPSACTFEQVEKKGSASLKLLG